jgi:GntR family transcriptional repressor for pyruvate dehydrogenase complex
MVDRSDASREWMTVLIALEEQLLTGGLKPGYRLPSERALASSLKARRSSVREALRVFEVVGLISTRPGTRLGSAGILVASQEGGMGALMRLQVAAQGFRVNDVERTRLLLESAIAKDLAERHDSTDLTALNELFDLMEDPTLSLSEYILLNSRFHVALAEAAGNKVVIAVMAGLRHAIEAAAREQAGPMADSPTTIGHSQEEHRELLDAISAGDGARAVTVIKNHISGYYDEIHVASEAS